MAATTLDGGDVADGYGDLPGLGPGDHVGLVVDDGGSSSYHSSGDDEDLEEEAALSMEDRVKLAVIWVANPTSSHHWASGAGGGVVPTQPTALCTQESINFRKDKLKAVMEEELVFEQAHNSSDESEDAYDSDNIPFCMEEHVDQDEDSDEEQLHFEGDTDVEDLFEMEEDEQEEEDVNFFAREEPAKRRKKLEVSKGPTTRSHSSVLKEMQPDFIPSSDEEGDCFLFEDEDDGHEPPSFVLPKGRKSRSKKRKPRIWYNEKLEQPHQELCLYMCFKDQHQFREALLSLHITHARDFRYHKNSDQRIIACCKQDHYQFCIVAAVIKGEKTFAIKKMRLEHTCPTNTEKSRISENWLAKIYESLFRSDPSTSIHTLIDNWMEKYGVDVARHMAYRAKNLVVEAVLGEHKK
ncbi:hypothetical protein D1007_52220 [Hordeum vulgare]|nr:hypothetical protein D1007_52220 [Hordeum vulgare]